MNTNGSFNVCEAPAANELIEADGPVGEDNELLNCVTNPPAAQLPAFLTVIDTVTGNPCTGFVGENEIPATCRSAHGGAIADA